MTGQPEKKDAPCQHAIRLIEEQVREQTYKVGAEMAEPDCFGMSTSYYDDGMIADKGTKNARAWCIKCHKQWSGRNAEEVYRRVESNEATLKDIDDIPGDPVTENAAEMKTQINDYLGREFISGLAINAINQKLGTEITTVLELGRYVATIEERQIANLLAIYEVLLTKMPVNSI